MNDGRELEQLVARMESMPLPEGFKVERRQIVRDEEGNQIAELDIVITGKVGSAPFTMLIECRDRPSEGAAPIGWIEQLVGRKQRLGFNTVVAVSSTGFSKAAEVFAGEEGVVLRRMSDVGPEEVADHLPRFSPLVIRNHDLKYVLVTYCPVDDDQEHDLKFPPSWIPVFTDRTTGYTSTVQDHWNSAIAAGKVFQNVPENGVPVERVLVLDGCDVEHLTAVFEGHELKVMSIELRAILSISCPQMPLVSVKEYQVADQGDQTVIAEQARWIGQPGDPVRELQFIGIRKKEP